MLHHMIKYVLAALAVLIAISAPLTASAQAGHTAAPYITVSSKPAITISVFRVKPSASTLTANQKKHPTVVFTSTSHQLARQGSQDSALVITSPTAQTAGHGLPFLSKDTAPMIAFTVLVVMIAWTSIGGNEVVSALFKNWRRRN